MAGDPTQQQTAVQDLLVVPPAALNGSAALNGHLTAHWSVQPDFSRLDADALPGLRDRVRALSGSKTGVSVFGGREPSLDDMRVTFRPARRRRHAVRADGSPARSRCTCRA